MKETEQYLQEHPFRVHQRRTGASLQRSGIRVPWWRTLFVGYPASVLLVGISLLTTQLVQAYTSAYYFIGAPFFLVTVIVALLWGTGPAVLAIVLGFFALEGFVIPPPGILTFNGWNDVAMYGPFVVAQLIVALITAQRESVRWRLYSAQQEARARAQELAKVNEALEQVNHKLERSNQLKDQFLSRASHELKTPITTIRGHTELGLRWFRKQSELSPDLELLRTHFEKVEAQTQRLHALVDDLLDLSSLEAGKLPLRLSLCDLGELCRAVVEEQRALSGRRIDEEIPAGPVLLQADCDRLTQVIINLVANAVKYSPENTVVHVGMQQDTTQVTLSVHNDGSVIPQEEQASIFEPFYRSTGAQSSSKRGWGLGLAISKEIVERQGGRIWVESSAEKGTTFFVRLPLDPSS
ncbi:MAG: sensor histidine kinase [Ktedonobacteraceae bacterium]